MKSIIIEFFSPFVTSSSVGSGILFHILFGNTLDFSHRMRLKFHTDAVFTVLYVF